MSLAISFCTCHGIIMSADRCITTTLSDGKSFCATMSEQKLFISKNGYGFSYTGASTYKGKPASYWMDRFICYLDRSNLTLSQYLESLSSKFRYLDNTKNIIIIGCCFHNNAPMVYSISSASGTLTDHLSHADTCIAFSGESNIAKQIIDMLPIDYKSYTLFDAIEFVKHVTLTTSNIQKFALTPITVSPTCDILKITNSGINWVVEPISAGY